MPDPEVMNADEPPPRRTAFEWSLAALRPMDSGAERPSFLFKAGQASRERAVRFWRWVAVGSLVLLGGVTAVGFALVVDLRHRAEVAEARVASQALTPRPPLPRAPSGSGGEGVTEAPGLPRVEDEREANPLVVRSRQSDSPPLPSERSERGWERGPGAEGLSSTPAEVAAALRTRRDILTAGLGVIPNSTPAPPPTALERELNTAPPTVLTIPRIAPKKPAPIVPDDEPPIDPDISR